MKRSLAALAVILLAAGGAHARGRVFSSGGRRGVVRSTGRATYHAAPTRSAAPSSSGQGFAATRSSSGGTSSRGTAVYTTHNGAASGSGFSRSLSGASTGRSRTSSYSSGGRFMFGRAFGSSFRRTSSTPADGGGDAAIPPYYTKPGALIRSEGQLPQYSDPGNARTHSVDGGGFIAQESAKARDVGRSPGVTWGAPDTPPGANPSGSGAGGNGVTANGPDITVNNSHSNNVNGNQNAGGSHFDPSF